MLTDFAQLLLGSLNSSQQSRKWHKDKTQNRAQNHNDAPSEDPGSFDRHVSIEAANDELEDVFKCT